MVSDFHGVIIVKTYIFLTFILFFLSGHYTGIAFSPSIDDDDDDDE